MSRECKAIIGSLTEYLEGEACKEICRRIEKHLRGCVRCQMHVDNMKIIITLYKHWRDVEIPDTLSVRLKEIIAQEMSAPPTGPKRKSRRPSGRKK